MRGQAVSRPTVYRTLSELVDAGLLREMVLNGRSVYEHDYGYPQHDHLHCEKCDKLIEFSSDEVKGFARPWPASIISAARASPDHSTASAPIA